MGTMKNKIPEYSGEAIVWNAFLNNLPNQFIIYNSQTVKGLQYDFCILAPSLGLCIVEVKGWSPTYVINVSSTDEILLTSGPTGSPLNQAKSYRFAVINYLREKLGFNPLVTNLVCYPLISKSEFYDLGLNYVSDEQTTLLKEEIEDKNLLLTKIKERFELDKNIKHDALTPKMTALIRNEFEPGYNLQEEEELLNPGYSRLRVISETLVASQANEIIDEYFIGIKEIVFTKSRSDLVLLVSELEQRFKTKCIYSEDNKVLLGSHDFDPESIHTSYRVFNFEIYCNPNIAAICNNSILIEEGKCSEEQDRMLDQLAQLTGFNVEQFRIEHSSITDNILVTAGAGTGKTFSMVSRICYLCNKAVNNVVDIIDDVAMITFTNDAANNMKVRLKQAFMNYFVLTKQEKYWFNPEFCVKACS